MKKLFLQILAVCIAVTAVAVPVHFIFSNQNRNQSQVSAGTLAESRGGKQNRDIAFDSVQRTANSITGAELTDRWGSERIGADMMKEYLIQQGKTDEDFFVAVLDTGIDAAHPFLQGRVRADLGYNFVDNNTDISDVFGHGTHVAGTIVDCTPDNVKIIPVKVLNDSGHAVSSQVALGLRYVADFTSAKVINMSLSFLNNNTHQFLRAAVDYVIEKGISIIVSAGNVGENAQGYIPAGYENVITVSSSDKGDFISSVSNYGDAVDVAAPGVGVLSSIPDGGYKLNSGTSMAAPHVTAAAAMLKLNDASLTPAQIEAAVKEMTVDVLKIGEDDFSGAGILDFRVFFGIFFEITTTIDYTDERLYGFEVGKEYTINGQKYTADESIWHYEPYGQIDIDASWLGTEISIVRLGDGIKTTDTEPKYISIPSRPKPPTGVKATDCTTDENNDGKIINDGTITGLEFWGIQYKKSTDTEWKMITIFQLETGITGLTNGDYHIRRQSTQTAFTSEILTITVAPFGQPAEQPEIIDNNSDKDTGSKKTITIVISAGAGIAATAFITWLIIFLIKKRRVL